MAPTSGHLCVNIPADSEGEGSSCETTNNAEARTIRSKRVNQVTTDHYQRPQT